LESIIEDKDIISSNTKDNVNNQTLQKSEVFDLENEVADKSSEWVTE
jgi:hypothetical protein